MPSLFVYQGQDQGALFDMEEGKLGIGRDASNQIQVHDTEVSRRHAEIHNDGTLCVVVDLGSSNGTFINGERLFDAAELKSDDVVQFADLALRVMISSLKSDSHTLPQDFCDHALARVQFDKLLREEIITPYFQPIVDLQTGITKAFEVLARSRLIGLETPGRMFAAAADTNDGHVSEPLSVPFAPDHEPSIEPCAPPAPKPITFVERRERHAVGAPAPTRGSDEEALQPSTMRLVPVK